VADGGEKLFDLFAVTVRTSDFLVAKDQDFEILVAFCAMVLEDWHQYVSLTEFIQKSLAF
jgi:hypothetical protein